jgi:hypothetical protein
MFELRFLKAKASEFQNLFSEIMEKRYPGDFVRSKPWGKAGDKKNDGYLLSKKTLYQIYAPNELSSADAIAKIKEDFLGAMPHWGQHLKEWVFTHNARDGLGPDVQKCLLEFQEKYPDKKFSHCTFDTIRNTLFSLDDAAVAALLGPAPSHGDFVTLTLQSIAPVVQALSKKSPAHSDSLPSVPVGKIEANALSADVSLLLQAGMWKAHLVGEFFRAWHRPQLGEEIAASFHARYVALKDGQMAPDAIFAELVVFAGGALRKDASHETAVLAVVAYFFERCDIFERPTEVPT